MNEPVFNNFYIQCYRLSDNSSVVTPTLMFFILISCGKRVQTYTGGSLCLMTVSKEVPWLLL